MHQLACGFNPINWLMGKIKVPARLSRPETMGTNAQFDAWCLNENSNRVHAKMPTLEVVKMLVLYTTGFTVNKRVLKLQDTLEKTPTDDIRTPYYQAQASFCAQVGRLTEFETRMRKALAIYNKGKDRTTAAKLFRDIGADLPTGEKHDDDVKIASKNMSPRSTPTQLRQAALAMAAWIQLRPWSD